jgi:hypothetical protein
MAREGREDPATRAGGWVISLFLAIPRFERGDRRDAVAGRMGQARFRIESRCSTNVVFGHGLGWVREEKYRAGMSALQQPIHSSLEASRHIRIVGVEPDTDKAVSVRGLRQTILLVCFCDGFGVSAYGELAVTQG